MTTNVERLLADAVAQLLAEQNFTTSRAAETILDEVLALDGLKQIDIPNVREPLFTGLQEMSKRMHGPISDAVSETGKDDRQADFGFLRLITFPAASEERPNATRTMPIDMNLTELLAHIGLKRKKAEDTRRAAERLQRFIDDHPEWADHPEWTMREVLGLRDDDRAA